MPRASKVQTAKNHAAIEQVSSRLFREQGLRVSVKDVMSAAGLTHGGFYGHFDSKDELAARACTAAFAESAGRWHQRTSGVKGRRSARTALIEAYLTAERRAAVGTGCPIAGLAVDVAREPRGRPVRAAFREGLEELIEILAGVQPTREPHDAHERAVVQMATLVGAMVLARATQESELSDEFLSAARRSLLGREA
jgi:TetR/AcrR family transcriptional regulator, transcriptional repressor for nem operon